MDLKTVKKLLAAQDRNELLRIVAALSRYDGADEWLLDYCAKKGRAENAEILAREQVLRHWFAADEFIDEANMYANSHRIDDALYELETLVKIAKKNKLSWSVRQPIVDKLVARIFENDCGGNAEFLECAENLCWNKEETCRLAEKLCASSQGEFLRSAARLYQKCGEEKLFVKLYSQNLQRGGDYVFLADYFKKNKQPEKAVRIAEDALNNPKVRLEKVYEWLFKEYKRKKRENDILELYRFASENNRGIETMTRLMVEYYAADREKEKPFLLKMAEVCHSDDAVKWFKECRKALTPSEFKTYSARLYRFLKEKNLRDYLQIRIDEGKTKEALDTLKALPPDGFKIKDADRGRRLTKQLAKFYPEEIAVLYWNEAESLCRVSNRTNYELAASILKEIKSVCQDAKLTKLWDRDFRQFLEKHRKKPRLMEAVAPLK